MSVKIKHELNDSVEQKIMKSATKLELEGYEELSLNIVIEALESSLMHGKNVYIEYKGQKLYSILDNVDSCYLKITGYDYLGYKNAKFEEYIERYNNLKLSNLDKNVESWTACVKDCLMFDKFYIIETILQVAELLDAGGTYQEAKEILFRTPGTGDYYTCNKLNSLTPKTSKFMDFIRKSEQEKM